MAAKCKMKKNSDKSNLIERNKSSLTAAAFQDHIVRELGLSNSATGTIPPHRRTSRHTTSNSTVSPHSSSTTNTQQLTLAQKLGLVAAPPPPLTNIQWDKAINCSSRRGDSTHPCPICQDVFGLQPQVLLSCTHTFHKSCLTAFERYSGKKRCPICRSPTYQTKLIHTGAIHHRHIAATKIQALWRGYKVRKVYCEYRKTHPPTHPSLRVKHFTQKLTSLTSELVDRVAMTTDSAENLLLSIDGNLRESRKVLESIQEPYNFLNPDWKNVVRKATQYTTSDCAICLTPLINTHTPVTSLNNSSDSNNRPLTILSCSHLYHTTCIHSLELFTDDSSLHYCPTCRLPYISKNYDLTV